MRFAMAGAAMLSKLLCKDLRTPNLRPPRRKPRPVSPWTGLCAFPITPADAAGRVDTAGVRRLVERLLEAGVDSIGLLGSTGTYAYLDRHERRRAVEAAAEVVAGRVPLLVGVGALRTDDAVGLAADAGGAGATAGLLAPMSYTPLTDDEVAEHYAVVAREGGLPLCLYDNPATTHFRFDPALLGRIARLPGLAAVKVPAGPAETVAGEVATLRSVLPDGIVLGCSGDWFAAGALMAGFDTWYSVAAGLFPTPCLRLARAVQAGDVASARALDKELQPLWALFRAHSSLRVMLAAARLMGLCSPVPPRPLLPLPASVEGEVAVVLDRLALR